MHAEEQVLEVGGTLQLLKNTQNSICIKQISASLVYSYIYVYKLLSAKVWL